MAMTMMALGEFRFALETAAYEQLVLSQSWRWPKQDRIGRDPALQFVGMEAAEIALDGVIYPTFKGGLNQIERLREMADRGQPLMLTDGLGRVWGKWVIEKIEDTRTLLMEDGQARKIVFRLTLKAYGEDGKTARWTPLASAKAPSAAIAAPQGGIDLAGLDEAIEALPEVSPDLPEDLMASVGEASASILDRLGSAIGEIAQGMHQAAQAIGSLPQRLPAALDLAVRDLIAELEAFGPPSIPRPAQVIGWAETVRHAARSIAGHGEMIALTGELVRARLERAMADDSGLDAVRPIVARLTEASRDMREIADLGRRVLEKWA